MNVLPVFNLNSNSLSQIEYSDDQELLETLITKYDSNLNPKNTRLSIGSDIFIKWDLPLEICLHYGETIKIYTFLINICVKFINRSLEIKVDSRRTTLFLKSLIKAHFGLPIAQQVISFNGHIIHDNFESLTFHKLKQNSCVYVTLKEVSDELLSREFSLKYCGKPIEFKVLLDKQDDAFSIREKIFDQGINPEKYVIRLNNQMLDQVRLTRHGKKYSRINIENLENIDLYPKHLRSRMPDCLFKKPMFYECNEKVPAWRIIKPGICLEGLCTNEECPAYNAQVIMSLCTPIIYKFGGKFGNVTCCPICVRFVMPNTISFNSTEWRFVAIKKSHAGLIRFKSDWKYADGDSFQYLTEGELAAWDSLVIETRNRSDFLTTEFKCEKCLSFHEPIYNEDSCSDDMCRHEHYDQYFYTDLDQISNDFLKYNLAD